MAFFKVSYNRVLETGALRNATLAVEADNQTAAKMRARTMLHNMGYSVYEITTIKPFNNENPQMDISEKLDNKPKGR